MWGHFTPTLEHVRNPGARHGAPPPQQAGMHAVEEKEEGAGSPNDLSKRIPTSLGPCCESGLETRDLHLCYPGIESR